MTLQRNNYPAQVLVADSLFQSLEKINSLLDSLSFVIEKTDSTGERLDIGVNLLVKTPAGIRVSEESFTVYQYSVKGLLDKNKQKNTDERLSSFRYLGTPEFNEVYFSKSSSIFILMTLRGLQNNLKKAALISFNDMWLSMK